MHEERDAPNQILIGAMDPLYCVLLGLTMFLEIFIKSGRGQLTPYILGFNDDFRIPKGGKKAKDWVQTMLAEEEFNLPEFNIGSLVGTHSLVLESMHLHMQGRMDARKKTRIFVVTERKGSVIRMSTMTLSSRSLMQKFLESSALVDHVIVLSKTVVV